MIEHKENVQKDVFVEEMKDLQRIDWPSIWEGPPVPTQEYEFREWCERHGWTNQTVERNLIVTTRHGTRLSFNSSGLWHPVKSMHIPLWRAGSENPKEKQEIISRAEDSLTEYVEAATSVFGPPSRFGRGDAQDFPDPPLEDLWCIPRDSYDNPYRMAYWAPFDLQKEHPYIILKQSHSIDTWDFNGGSGANINLVLKPPKQIKLPEIPDLRSILG